MVDQNELTSIVIDEPSWFLWLPVREGVVGAEGEAISRASYLFTSLLYPEMRLSTWIDGGRFPIGFSDRIPIMVGTCIWLGLSGWIGLPLVRPVYSNVATWGSRVEQCALAMLAGLGLLSSLILVLGLLGGLKSSLLLCASIVVLFLIVYGISRLSPVASSQSEDSMPLSPLTIVPRKTTLEQIFSGSVVGLTCIASAILMLGSWLPPCEFDVLEYHLQASKEFYQKGSIRFVPHNIYLNMQLGTEMHTLAMMALSGEEDA